MTMVATKKKNAKKRVLKKQDSPIQKIVNHYFNTKGLSVEQIKQDAKKQKIVYSRYVKSAKDLLELAGDVTKAKKALTRVANWASTRGLDYTIETVLKKWPELKQLKPKQPVRKAFYEGKPMRQKDGKWYVVPEDGGEWLEFADDESKIEWRTIS